MAYTVSWDETLPLGSTARNQIDDVIRNLKRDLRERYADMFGVGTFTTDPQYVPHLRMSGAPAKISAPGAGTISFRNAADNADNLSITDAGNVTIRGTLGVTGVLTGPGSGLTSLNASNLASGTVPDARFPATLPAASGANLTGLNAGNLATGTVPSARVVGVYGNITALGTLSSLAVTGNITSASDITTSGTGFQRVSAVNGTANTVLIAGPDAAGLTATVGTIGHLAVITANASVLGTTAEVNARYGLSTATEAALRAGIATGDRGLFVDNSRVVGQRVTGWTAATGTATRTTFVTSTVTLPQLAERVKAVIDDLLAHGLIGA